MLNKNKIKILSIKESKWNGEKTFDIIFEYRDKKYIKYTTHYVEINGCFVDSNFIIHLDKAWEKNFKNKIIRKTIDFINGKVVENVLILDKK